MFRTIMGFLGKKDLAMDLGTANTLLYTQKDGIVLNEPSVVAVDSVKSTLLSVGHEAKVFMGRTLRGINVIIPMSNGVIADFTEH